jgi:hypothetical protein
VNFALTFCAVVMAACLFSARNANAEDIVSNVQVGNTATGAQIILGPGATLNITVQSDKQSLIDAISSSITVSADDEMDDAADQIDTIAPGYHNLPGRWVAGRGSDLIELNIGTETANSSVILTLVQGSCMIYGTLSDIYPYLSTSDFTFSVNRRSKECKEITGITIKPTRHLGWMTFLFENEAAAVNPISRTM